ncbi:SgcJ/EcaC family oxidoreductase [Streptomyces sp. MS1.AVA.3]|uniref:SgcJ/EcaC family oxidoreductase n=1 Tax=Streptomyces decoyicus TaxID=249567 RepID=UPI0030BF1956
MTQDAPAREEDVRRIKEMFTELEAAATAHDAVALNGRFTADVTFTVADGRRFDGWEQIHAHHEERLEHHAEGFRTWFEIDAMAFPTPDVAVVSARQLWSAPHGEGVNTGTWVLTRKNGAWWFCAVQNTGVTAGQVY